MADHKDLQAFVEAALVDPKHPVYRLGMTHSPILQHYAVNVCILHAVEAEQWFDDYPDWTAKLTEVKRLCEEPEADELAALKAEVDELKKKLAEKDKPTDQPAEPTPPAEA